MKGMRQTFNAWKAIINKRNDQNNIAITRNANRIKMKVFRIIKA